MMRWVVVLALGAAPEAPKAPWARHTIDGTSKGADGVRLADANGDGRPDLVTGWEEGGEVRLYLHPGREKAKEPWPRVTVGRVRSPEDAVLADLDGDGAMDAVSACEGSARSIFIHWAPRDRAKRLDPATWTTEALPASVDRQAWMFCVPVQLDGRHGPDLLCGGKNQGAEVGWFEAPDDPRRAADWIWHPLSAAGWVMSLLPIDLDADGDLDVLLTDRKGPLRGVRWLENPGRPGAEWKNRFIGGRDREVMFLERADLDGDGAADLVVAAKDAPVLLLRARGLLAWEATEIPLPPGTGSGKAPGVADLDGDGKADLVLSCEHAEGEKQGVVALLGPARTPADISGPAGTKFDLVRILDLDGDGDLDVLTCEEIENLGVVWYENPLK
jgi:hypothetical protein